MNEEQKNAIRVLRRIKAVLDKLMNDPSTRVEIRLNELYDHLRRDPEISDLLPNPIRMSQFLRAQHQEGVMKQVIPNYRVDTSTHEMYQWYFFRERKDVDSVEQLEPELKDAPLEMTVEFQDDVPTFKQASHGMTLYIDMDNVLVDFTSSFDRVDPEILSAHDKNRDDIPGIFDLMDPMPNAIGSYKALSLKYNTFILSTAPWNNPSAWRSKVEWVHKHLGDVAYKRLILTHRKDLLHGHYLIDDRPNNGAVEFRGEWIQFGSSKYPDWDSVLAYLLVGGAGSN